MITRVSALLAGLVLAGTVYAADKPAAQARQSMEASTPAVVVHGGSQSVASSATKPAVAARLQREVETTEVTFVSQSLRFVMLATRRRARHIRHREHLRPAASLQWKHARLWSTKLHSLL